MGFFIYYFHCVISKSKLSLLSVLSGVLLYLAWPPLPFIAILFFAFIPLLIIEHKFISGQTTAKPAFFFGLLYLAFFIWNVSATWWVCNASLGGGAMAILANSLLMSMVFWLFHLSKKKVVNSLSVKPNVANWLLPIYWIAFEYFHNRWELSWPWLTLGNAFGGSYTWVQWYEFTGVPGGSLWVLAVNLLIFNWLLSEESQPEKRKRQVVVIVSVIVVPILVSYSLYYSYHQKKDPVNVVVVQPNIDPYTEKFGTMGFEEQLHIMLDLAVKDIDSTTDYLVFPETALTEEIWENEFKQTTSIHVFQEFLKHYPHLKIITGAATWYLYQPGEILSASARKFKQQDGYYDAYNTALQIDSTDSIQVYHKSKLVPGVERMPYPAVFGFLEKLAIDLGGAAGSLGTQEERTVFTATDKKDCVVAPVVCYESIYGEYVGGYIKNGASLIFIITNDGWWRDTPGYKQHLVYGRLRAIETHRCIARSANTGISCFINERGDISQETQWWVPAVITGSIDLNSEETFYVKFGDVIGKISIYGFVLLIAYTLILIPIFKKK